MLKDFADHIGVTEDYVQDAISPNQPNEDP
jgi:hypothetical protein